VTIEVVSSESGMDLRDLLDDEEFARRVRSQHRSTRWIDALDRLAHVFTESPSVVLQTLVDIAVEYCGADSSGISLEEIGPNGEARFRWISVSGTFKRYLNGTTPRNYSPCGTTLNRGRPQLYRVTKPYYDFLGVQADPITDGILIPWASGEIRGTLWAVSHGAEETFDLGDYKILKSLADFAAIAIRHRLQTDILLKQEQIKASAARANELAHQINNPLQSLTNSLYLASNSDENSQVYVAQAVEQLEALSGLVGRLLKLQ
jgi:hypothetical protein